MNLIDNPLQSIGEIHRLKLLCARAADALGKYGAYCPLPTEDIAQLIAELRKAAE